MNENFEQKKNEALNKTDVSNRFLTSEEFAQKLDGREYRSEITREEHKEAFENGLIVVYGASDDLIEFNGCIDDELSAYRGACFGIKSKNMKVKEDYEGDKNNTQLPQSSVSVSAGLSGKTKEAFQDWLFTIRNEEIVDGEIKYDLYYMFMYMLPESCKNAIIIEFFDSVDVCIQVWSSNPFGFKRDFDADVKFKGKLYEVSDAFFNTRQEAINTAIEKANEIYNTEAEH